MNSSNNQIRDFQEYSLPQDVQEISLGISASNLYPHLLTPDFLLLSGIISSDWQLEREPINNGAARQLNFINGVNIIANPGNITFVENIGDKPLLALQAPRVAAMYVSALPYAEYQGLSLSFKSLVPFPGRQDAARNYFIEKILAPGSWQQFGKAPVQTGINLSYLLELCQLSLSINEARLQESGKAPIAALLFSGSFNYNLAIYNKMDRLSRLKQHIEQWNQDLEKFRELVYSRFLEEEYLGQQVNLFPPSLF